MKLTSSAVLRSRAWLGLVALVLTGTIPASAADARARHFTLDNGLDLVVIEDRRAPVVTHMVWYRVGAADDPVGKSGLAHFVEHLMFKSTGRLASGEFSRLVAGLGGNDNALTSHDSTLYYQRVAREHLATVMALEADRMVNLRFTPEEVAIEREVVIEERRQRIDASPLNVLSEEINAALYRGHPYAVPVLGWPHEIMRLDVDDARIFYERHYAPMNAIIVIAGDVAADEALQLARASYGQLPRRESPTVSAPSRLPEPEHGRRIVRADMRVSAPTFYRAYSVPGAAGATGHEAEALEVLTRILAQGETSRLHGRLVREGQLAVSTEGGYRGATREAQVAIYAVGARGVEPDRIESGIDAAITELRDHGVTEAELERARNTIEAKHAFDSDSQLSLAMRYGEGLVSGRSIASIEGHGARLAKVTREDVQAAAARYLAPGRAVTGWLLPAEADARSADGTQAGERDR
ncbi:MAG: pitrilysin family protein [Pseudomonadota bacterium]